MRLELDIAVIDQILEKDERNRAWLGRKIGATNASMYYIWINKPISQAERIAAALGIEPKRLIKQIQE
jgi:hypothetical protein